MIIDSLGLAVFIVIARLANGVTWELENVGIETYYRRIIDSARIATSFGYIETWSHAAWILASLASIVLVRFLPVHYLLLAIAPFAIVAYIIALRAPEDSPGTETGKKAGKPSPGHSYFKAATRWRTWDIRLWLLCLLVLFSSMIGSLMYFFIPIDAFLTGANLPMVVLISVFGSIPALFGYALGRLADRRNKFSLLVAGLLCVAAIAVGLALFPSYWFKLVAMLLMGVMLELFYVVQSGLITTLGPVESYGERGSAFEGIITVGDLAAPLILGIGLDLVGFTSLSYVIAGAAAVLAVSMGLKIRHQNK